MTNLSTAPGVTTTNSEWLHWLFRQGDQVVSCSYNTLRDGTCTVTLVPLWSPRDEIVETFLRPSSATEWLDRTTQRLQAAGWRLVEAGVVKHAA